MTKINLKELKEKSVASELLRDPTIEGSYTLSVKHIYVASPQTILTLIEAFEVAWDAIDDMRTGYGEDARNRSFEALEKISELVE